MDSDRMPLGNRPLTLCFNLLARVAAQTHPAALNSPESVTGIHPEPVAEEIEILGR